MKMTKAQFTAYVKRHKIAANATLEEYIAENDKETYVYDDVEAVYQLNVTKIVNARTANPSPYTMYCAGGGYRTVTGVGYTDKRG